MPRTSEKTDLARNALTDLILNLFRVNNLLLNAGDRLLAALGLTSARWQIQGAIVYAGRPQPVAWLARDLGANRQNVQRVINDLEDARIVAFEPNPHHRRAQLVVLTDKGRKIYGAALRLQAPWVENLADGLTLKNVRCAQRALLILRQRLESSVSSD